MDQRTISALFCVLYTSAVEFNLQISSPQRHREGRGYAEKIDSRTSEVRSLARYAPPGNGRPAHSRKSLETSRLLIRLDGDCLCIRRVECRNSTVLCFPRELAFSARLW